MTKTSPFYVPPVIHLLGGWVQHYPHFWRGLGRLESQQLGSRLGGVQLVKPIYVCGLARSGSTLLHEVVTTHQAVASHRNKDYPLVFTPYWSRQSSAGRPAEEPRERAHGDRMLVTSESPDALEEMLWMAFFPGCHDPRVNNELTAATRNRAFEEFYPNHLRKLLLVEHRTRYAAKNNYHVARLGYLRRLFPDARFLIPVREPVGHIVSLLRQQERFSGGQRKNRRFLAYMQRSGHFEFGLDRRPLNLGDAARVSQIQRAWVGGQEVRGWAIYWAMVHDYLADKLENDPAVRAASLVVRFEDLCAAPAEGLRRVFDHCALDDSEALVAGHAAQIRQPDYYKNPLRPKEVDLIKSETARAAARWGYV